MRPPHAFEVIPQKLFVSSFQGFPLNTKSKGRTLENCFYLFVDKLKIPDNINISKFAYGELVFLTKYEYCANNTNQLRII